MNQEAHTLYIGIPIDDVDLIIQAYDGYKHDNAHLDNDNIKRILEDLADTHTLSLEDVPQLLQMLYDSYIHLEPDTLYRDALLDAIYRLIDTSC